MFAWIIILIVVYFVHKLYVKKTPVQLDSNSVVVITGACNGIGRRTALLLAERYKCRIVILDIMANKFKDIQKELEDKGSVVACYKCDLSSENSMNDVLREIRANYDKIDVLINNAGIVIPKAWDQQTYADHSKTMAVNYLAPVFFTLNLKDKLKGHVVTIASVAALMRGNNLSSYMASKHAVYGFFNCVRTELAGQPNSNITFSMVCPYAIDTGMFTGFETRLNKIVPMLKEEDVGKIVADVVVSRQEVVFIPWWIGAVIKLTSLIPDVYLDRLSNYLDTSNYKNNPALKKE